MPSCAWAPAPGLEDQVSLGVTFGPHLERNYIGKKYQEDVGREFMDLTGARTG